MARSDGSKSSDLTKKAKDAAKSAARGSVAAQEGATDEAKLRSDWEGMAPKPDQASDDIASPGALPPHERTKNPSEN